MNCSQANPLLPRHMDGDLEEQQKSALNAHLAECPNCRLVSEGIAASSAALRSLRPGTASPDLQATILQAVYASSASDDPIPVPIHAGRMLASHTLALLTGAVVAAACLLFIPWLSESLLEPRVERVLIAAEPKIQYVERRVEIPVEVPVEVPVEIVRIVYRDTPPSHSPDATALDGLADSLDQSTPSEAPQQVPAIPASVQPPPSQQVQSQTSPTIPSSEASVQVVHSSGLITLHTQGPIEKLVPMLLGKLDSSDPELVAVIERRLVSLRSAVEADELLGPRLVELNRSSPGRSLGSRLFGHSSPPPPRNPQEEWSDWWKINGDLVASAEHRLLP